jgi:hypothetical protein
LSLHALTFSIIMIAVGLWQFRRAGRMARIDAEIAAAPPEQRQSYDALGYPPTRPRSVRLMGALMIAAGLAAALIPLLAQK